MVFAIFSFSATEPTCDQSKFIFECPNDPVCVASNQICDRTPQCLDKSDENPVDCAYSKIVCKKVFFIFLELGSFLKYSWRDNHCWLNRTQIICYILKRSLGFP